MFTEAYIAAILTDPKLADEVWELWDAEVITDEEAVWGWFLVCTVGDSKIVCPPVLANRSLQQLGQ